MRAWRESACARKGRAAHESDACQSGLGFLGLGLHVQPGRSVRASTSKRARTKRRPGRHADGERVRGWIVVSISTVVSLV